MPVLLAAVVSAALLGPAATALAADKSSRQAISQDADQPIEINADSLEVLQEKNLAVFTGNVDATQGRIRLRADTLNVWYRPGGSADKDVNGTIQRIEAQGRVFVSSPEETAQGDNGIYDVEKKTITLTGQVVLTRGENVIRGQKLVLDIASGRSRIVGGGNRVKGLFVPPKKEEQNGKRTQ